MSIDNNDDNDDSDNDHADNTDGHNTDGDGDGGNENAGFEDGGGDIDHSLETVFCRPPHAATSTINLDTESEASDEEESQQQPAASLPPNPENFGCPGLPSTQTGRYSYSTVNYLRTLMIGDRL